MNMTQTNWESRAEFTTLTTQIEIREPSVQSGVVLESWPGVQLYYPPVKYSPMQGAYEDQSSAHLRFLKHANNTAADTLIFDLEDGCCQKELGRQLLRQELPRMQRGRTQVAIRINRFRTKNYDEDLKLVRELSEYVDIVMLAKAGELYGSAEIRDLSSTLSVINQNISVQPIIEHPQSLRIAREIMQYSTVKHVVFGIHDFSKAMGMQITPASWMEDLKFFLNQLMFEARLAGKGVIGGVETVVGREPLPEHLQERQEVEQWLECRGDPELQLVYRHACMEASLGLTGKQVIHPGHIRLCKVAYTPALSDIKNKVAMLKSAMKADALLGGAIRFEDEMVDPPMFGKALQVLLRAHALGALPESEKDFLLLLLSSLPSETVRENWPYGAIL
jgi:citrate lyase beta subunit